jgi:hypothetical protein
VQPLADSFPHKRPTFTVTNAARTGPPATVTYRFDVGTDAAFSNVVATGTVHNRLSGAISGVPNYPLPNPGPFVNAVSFGGVVGGDADNAGRFEGTFDGSAELIREGFPCYDDITCSTSGFTWTLTPH